MSGPAWPGQEVATAQAPPTVAAPPGGAFIQNPGFNLEQQQRQASIQNSQTNVVDTAHDNALQDRTTRITNAQTLRKEFNTLPQVATYQTVIQQAAAALKAESTPTGDQQLITAYAKALDPNSVVREGEFSTVANADSAAGRLWAKFQKEGGFDDAGLLRPEVRDRVRRGLINLATTANQAYAQQRDFYGEIAKRNQLDPFEVIGPDLSEPYKPTLDAFEKSQQQGQANEPTNKDVYANGVQLAGSPGDDGAFDRDAYLRSIGVDPGKETRVIGFWNANQGNANLTPDAVKQWYAGQGVPVPSDADITAAIDKAKKGQTFQGFDTSAAEKAYKDRLDAAIKTRGDNPEAAGEAMGNGAGQGILLGGLDEIAGVSGAVRGAFDGNPVGGYQVERDIARREQERSSAAHPYLHGGAELAGSFATAPIGMGEAATVADATKAAAGIGAVAGFNSGEGAVDSLTGAGVGGLIGAGVGAGGQKAADYLASRTATKAAVASAAPPSEGAQVIAAADRLNDKFGTNIQPLPADVGGPGTRMATGAAATLPLGAPQIVRGAQAVTREAEAAKTAIANLAGTPTTDEAAGEAALTGARKYIKISKTKVDALYTKARQLGGSEPVDLANARDVLDRNIAELSQTPGGAPGLAELKGLRGELDKPYPVEGVRAMRTTLRDRFLGDGLRGSDLERRVGQVVDAAETDVADSLAAASKTDAAQAYKAAASAHRERVDVIDNVLAPIIGKNGEKSVEDVMKSLDSAAKTKGARLGKFLNAMPPDDAGTVRATLINNLGRVSKGRQDAEGTAFSLNDFLTHWNQLSGPAKGQLFGGELRSALDDLARVAQGTKEAQRFENSSKTGAAVGQLATGALLVRLFAEPMTAAAGFGGQFALGRLLSRPSFARWLAKMPDNPALAGRHIQSLSKIASADSTIAADALGLQHYLTQAFSANPAKLTANTGTSTTGSGTQ